VIAATGLLVGCSGASSSNSPSHPSGSLTPLAAVTPGGGGTKALAPFYDQKLTWSSCHDVYQCATLTVPEDYGKPTGKALHIAVIREPASGSRAGSLIINPGGPGASGVNFVVQDATAFSQLTDHYDLVSFDPRGVGQSDPVRCVTSQQLDAFVNTNPVPADGNQLATLVGQARAMANGCFAKNGSYLSHIGTIDEARDMDVLRSALGDRKLTYYGASYGTYLGAKYAQLFPTHIRALVLDGALNPAESLEQGNLVQAKGFQTDLDDMLAACVKSGSCPLGSTEAAAHAGLEALKAQVTAQPEHTTTGRVLGPGEFFEGLAAGLYSPDTWKPLWTVLAAVKAGNPAGLLLFADSLTERNNDGSYSNLIESNLAINCVDRPAPRRVSSYTSAARAFAKQAPDFGAAIEYGALPCAFWRVPPVEKTHPVHAAGAPPILVIGTTRDPATPYVWAQALASQLKSGVLLTYTGDGHTAYVRHNLCVDAAVHSYVEDLTPPKAGTVCS
jgi:pimeloyl-ACP methyl ester carboxylesterase